MPKVRPTAQSAAWARAACQSRLGGLRASGLVVQQDGLDHGAQVTAHAGAVVVGAAATRAT
jgi:hypothetical protein